jgi:predicted RNA-binding protein
VNTTKKNIEIENNNSIIAFLEEQYGEKVRDLLGKIQNSVITLDYKGEKDEIAKEIEQIHNHPIESNYKMASIWVTLNLWGLSK